MNDVSRSSNRISLPVTLYVFAVTVLLLMSGAAAVVVSSRSEGLVDSTLDAAVASRTQAASEIFARTLFDDWQDLQFVADSASGADLQSIRDLMTGMRGDGSRISWIGYTNVRGQVLAATETMLEGADVSQRPWFRNGLSGGFAGDLHEAVLLADLLEQDGDEPLRFIDLAVPVRDGTGEVTGVVGVHVDGTWVAESLQETGRMLGLDLFLIDQGGTVVMAPEGNVPNTEELGLLGAARTGASSSGRETWPDGEDYFAALVPSVGYRDLPSFGWRMAGRIRSDVYRPSLIHLRTTVLLSGALAAGLLLLAAALYARILLRPISGLADTAETMAEGGDVYPPENHSSEEAEQLSVALSKMQARLLPRRGGS